jgi:hypothetical protein
MAKKKAISESFSTTGADAARLGSKAQFDRDFRDRLTRAKGWVRAPETKSTQWGRWNP